MRSLTLIISLFLCFLHTAAFCKAEPAGSSDTLIKIGSTRIGREDFMQWWQFWGEDQKRFPKSPKAFVDWQLLADEARRMELDQEPAYKRKLEVFLEARSLMRLKMEEVDSKISTSEEALQQYYKDHFVPLMVVSLLQSPTMDLADKTAQAYQQSKKEWLAFLETWLAASPQSADISHQHLVLRQQNAPPQLYAEAIKLQPNQLSEPFLYKSGGALLFLVSKKEADPDDFARNREQIKKILRRQQHIYLTQRLINRLRGKFAVRVHTELLAQIDLTAPQQKLMDQILIESNRSQVNVSYFLSQFYKDQQIRKLAFDTPARQQEVKENIANRMIANSLISWEALDRHYEKIPPLKPAYDFYQKHRLVRELEGKLLPDRENIEERDLRQYYVDHPQAFTRPARYRYLQATGDSKAIQNMWIHVLSGKDFLTAATEAGLNEPTLRVEDDAQVPSQILPVLKTIKPGAFSDPISLGEQSALIKIIERTPPAAAEFHQVKEIILQKLIEEGQEKARNALLDKLRSKIEIEINTPLWESVYAEMSSQFRQMDEEHANGNQ